jgi:acetolactate synthase-1/2/3 large subunit
MARSGLDVTTVLLNNHSYAVLNMELDRVGADAPGPRARDMLDLGHPSIDYVQLATGLGLHAARAETTEAFTEELARALATPGPSLVEAVVPSLL